MIRKTGFGVAEGGARFVVSQVRKSGPGTPGFLGQMWASRPLIAKNAMNGHSFSWFSVILQG